MNLNRENLVAAIWAVGLKEQIKDELIDSLSEFLKGIAKKIEARFAFI